jgi:serine/threonine protein kinase
VKITDFGIAKASNSLHRTRAGMIKGKYSYMSPQQCLGEEVDPRTDVFSLGIVLFEITTGRRLFARASEPETIRALLDDPIPRPSTVYPDYPEILEGIVMHCLERNPEHRYQDAWELHQDLERFMVDRKRPPTSMDIAAVMEEVFPLDARRRPARPSMVLEGVDVYPPTGSASSRSSVKMVLTTRELLLLFVIFAIASGLLWLTVFLARR